MLRKPGRRRRLFAVRQKCHRPASLKIADDGPVRVVAPPRPIVNADHVQTVRRQAAAPTNDAQQGVVADRNHQPPRKACRGSASQRQSEMVDNEIESGRPSRGRRQHGVAETLGKNSPTAEHCVTAKAARRNDQTDTSPGQREIGDAATIMAMDPSGRSAARRANPDHVSMSDRDDNVGSLDRHPIDLETRRHKLGRSKPLIHGADPSWKTAPSESRTSSKVSQSPDSMPKHLGGDASN